MADIQTEGLADAATLARGHYLSVSQGGQDKKTTLTLLATFLRTLLDLVYMPFVALGTAGYVLRVNAAGNAIEWSNIPSPKPVVTKTAAYTPVVGTDHTIFLAPTVGMILTLPTAVGNGGVEFEFKRTTATGVVTFNTTGGQLLDNNASGVVTMAATINLCMRVKSDGANWWRFDKTAA